MTNPAVHAAALRCRYGDFEAVRGIDLTVGAGELFALLGTNGAGKTTTMEVLAGQRAADEGQVRVLGLDPVADRARLRPRMGTMPQESGFPADLTVRETLGLWRALSSRAGDIAEVLDRVDLAHRADVRLRGLSGGERRRLDLALAVLNRPEVLFLDEPTTGLDPESRLRTWEIVRSLLDEGATVLLTTHYLEEAEHLADRLAIMHQGRIVVSGALTEVLERESARISFTCPSGTTAADLPALRGTVDPAALATGEVAVRTPALQDDLTAVLTWASTRGVRLAKLRAHHASLADVFHGIRDRQEVPA
ncbi:ABC transporter ATP-binding protein [Actinokineospora sp. 24-640]